MATIPVNFRIEEEADQKLAALAAASFRSKGKMIEALVAQEWARLEAAGQAPALAIDENGNGNHGQAA